MEQGEGTGPGAHGRRDPQRPGRRASEAPVLEPEGSPGLRGAAAQSPRPLPSAGRGQEREAPKTYFREPGGPMGTHGWSQGWQNG